MQLDLFQDFVEKKVYIVEELICGKCAQERKLELEERINISLKRKKGLKYYCSFCKNEHELIRRKVPW